MFKASGKGCNLSSTDQKAINSISLSSFTFLSDVVNEMAAVVVVSGWNRTAP